MAAEDSCTGSSDSSAADSSSSDSGTGSTDSSNSDSNAGSLDSSTSTDSTTTDLGSGSSDKTGSETISSSSTDSSVVTSETEGTEDMGSSISDSNTESTSTVETGEGEVNQETGTESSTEITSEGTTTEENIEGNENDTSLDQTNENEVTEAESTGGLVDPRVLIIHSSTSSKMTNEAAHNILNLINPVQPGLVNFDIRTTTQIGAMTPDELKTLIENADIVLCEWMFEPGLSNFSNLVNNNPEITHNKPNKIFLVLESNGSLTKLSQINGNYLFGGVPDSVIGDTSITNTILYDLKNANITRLNNYKTQYPQIGDWIDAGLYYAQSGTPNYENQIKWALKKFTELNGGTWPSQWNPAQPAVPPKELLFRNGEIFTSLNDYLTKYPIDTSKPTIGIVDYTSPLYAGDTQHYQAMIDELLGKGFNVIPVVGAYSGTSGTQPVNIYSAMVKFFTYDPSVDNRGTANGLITTSQYEANPQNYSYRIDALIDFFTFSLGSGFLTQTNSFLDNMNVPVFRAMTSTKKTEGDWLTSDDGLFWSDSYYQIAIPETQGAIEPILVATSEHTLDPVTGADLVLYRAVPDRIEKLANRVENWVDLKYMPNPEKIIALVYYNYPPGKQNIGASYLDVPGTILNILNELKNQGYTVDNIPANVDQLVSMMLKNGINVANWAPGVLEEMANDPNTILWDADEYEAWFNTLDPIAKKQVTEGPVGYIEEITKLGVTYGATDDTAKTETLKTISKWTQEIISLVNTYPEKAEQGVAQINIMNNALQDVINNVDPNSAWDSFYAAKAAFMALQIPGLTGWGEPPGNIMTVTRNGKEYIVIPGLKFGNIFIGPEPQRGWEADASKFYHSTVVPPPHQYLAWYAYVNQVLDADAQVHIGRHATYEWLPRKQIALSSFDYSDIMIEDAPSIYIYTMDGVGEGLQAKRRGYAVIVDHMIPPLETTNLYGELLDLKGQIENYDIAKAGGNQDLMGQYALSIRNTVSSLHLDTDLEIDLNTISNDELVDKTENYLRNIQDTLMPYGLHTFGTSWTNEEIALLATSMVTADGGTGSPSLQRLIAQENGWNFDDLTLDQAEQLNNQAQEWVLQLFTGEKTASELTSNTALQNKLNEAKGYADKIDQSFNSEMNALMDALSGGYVTPSSGNDPIRNPGALPTGKNFSANDDSKLPTKVAWNLGKKLADMALAQLDTIPEKIAAVVWCVETARDDGTMASFVLRMLGVEPTWTTSGGINKIVATPLSTLLSDLNTVRASMGLPALTVRPRIDVVTTTSGLFRDLYPRLLWNMDRSYRVALAASYNTIIAAYPSLQTSLDYALQTLVDAKYWTAGQPTSYKGSESLDQNYIAKHWVELTQELINLGIPANDAGELAITRIFAPPVGDYGAGVNKGIEQAWTWDNRDQLADIYLNRMSHAYSERNWGTSNPELFSKLLEGITVAYHSRSTNLYGVLDNDDYADYFGGLSMAIEKVNNGQAPKLNVVYYANPAKPQIMSLQTFMAQEMRTRYFNPEWIQGMMNEGYSGARYISNKFVSYLMLWQVTNPNIVQDWMWYEVNDIYMKDKYNLGVDQWLSNGNNAYAKISIQGTMLTMANKGFWNVDQRTLNQLANNWANDIRINGVACCDCSCGNIAMMKWATQFINPNMLSQFYSQVYQATQNPIFAPQTPTNPTNPTNPSTDSSFQTRVDMTVPPVQAEQTQTQQTTAQQQTDNPEQPSTSQQPGSSQQSGTTGLNTGAGQSTAIGAAQQSSGQTGAGQQTTAGANAHEISTVDQSTSPQSGMPIWALGGVILLLILIAAGYFRSDILGFLRR